MPKTYTKFAILAAFYLSLTTVSSSLLRKRDHAIKENTLINCGLEQAMVTGRGDSYTGKDALAAVAKAMTVYVGGPSADGSFGGPSTYGYPKDSGYASNSFPGYPSNRYLVYPMAKAGTWPEKQKINSQDLVVFDENFQAITAVRPIEGGYQFCEIVPWNL